LGFHLRILKSTSLLHLRHLLVRNKDLTIILREGSLYLKVVQDDMSTLRIYDLLLLVSSLI